MTEDFLDLGIRFLVSLVVTTYCAAFVATAVGAAVGIWANVRWALGRTN